MSIWREISSGTYDRIDGIELGICGSEDPAPSVMGMSNVYECTLPQSERVSVQPGDVVGIELSAANAAKFRLYFDPNSGSKNYEFNSHSDSMFSLSQASSTIMQDQPQISLTVDRMAATGPAPTEASTMAMTTETQASTNITGAPETTTMEMTGTIESTAGHPSWRHITLASLVSQES